MSAGKGVPSPGKMFPLRSRGNLGHGPRFCPSSHPPTERKHCRPMGPQQQPLWTGKGRPIRGLVSAFEIVAMPLASSVSGWEIPVAAAGTLLPSKPSEPHPRHPSALRQTSTKLRCRSGITDTPPVFHSNPARLARSVQTANSSSPNSAGTYSLTTRRIEMASYMLNRKNVPRKKYSIPGSSAVTEHLPGEAASRCVARNSVPWHHDGEYDRAIRLPDLRQPNGKGRSRC